jgi:hypothetical protein
MGYLSSYKLNTLEELIAHETKNSKNYANLNSKYFGENQKKSNQENKNKFYINYESFSRIFKPTDKKFRPKQSNKKQLNYNKNKVIRESEFYIIRQIILLTFRKLDEIGMVVQYLKEHPYDQLFELICGFNDGMFMGGSETSNRFDSEQDPMKCRQIFGVN